MRTQRIPSWIKSLKQKVTFTKLNFLFLWIIEAAFIAISITVFTSGEYIIEDWLRYPWIIVMIVSCILIVSFGIGCWVGMKVRYRKYGEYYACLYAGLFKNYLIVENEIQDSAYFESYYYGQFPDNTPITVKVSPWDGSITFAFGASQNLNLTEF